MAVSCVERGVLQYNTSIARVQSWLMSKEQGIQILQAKGGWPDWKSATPVRWKSNWKLCILRMPNFSNETCYVLFCYAYWLIRHARENSGQLVTLVIPSAVARHKTIAKRATMLQKHAFFIWKSKRENKNISWSQSNDHSRKINCIVPLSVYLV